MNNIIDHSCQGFREILIKNSIGWVFLQVAYVQFGILKLVKDLFKGDLGWTFYILNTSASFDN